MSAFPETPRRLQDRGSLIRDGLQFVRKPQKPPDTVGHCGRRALDHDLAEKFRDLALDIVQNLLAMQDVLFGRFGCRPSQHVFDPRQEFKTAVPHEPDFEECLVAGDDG